MASAGLISRYTAHAMIMVVAVASILQLTALRRLRFLDSLTVSVIMATSPSNGS